jgi:hypothetical protein
MKNKAKKQNKASSETYSITRNVIKTPGHTARKTSKLGNTMRMLNIGDGFTYPFAKSSNVHRAARNYGYEMATQRTEKGILAVRCA